MKFTPLKNTNAGQSSRSSTSKKARSVALLALLGIGSIVIAAQSSGTNEDDPASTDVNLDTGGDEVPSVVHSTPELESIDPDNSILSIPETSAEREGLSYSIGPYDFTEFENFTRTPTELIAENIAMAPIVVTEDGANQSTDSTDQEPKNAIAYAPVHLPDEVLLRSMSIFAHDSAFGGSITAKLKRRSLTSGRTVTLISISTGSITNDAEHMGYVLEAACEYAGSNHVHSSPGATHTVNNDNYIYYLEVSSLERNLMGSMGALKLYGAIIDYKE